MLDARLFNREQYSASFGSSDSYNLYDKPLFSGSSAAAAIYKPRGRDVDDEGFEVNAEEVDKAMRNDRFGLGVAGKGRGFEGTDTSEVRDGCVPSSSLSLVRGRSCTRADLALSRPQPGRLRARHGRPLRRRRVPRVGQGGRRGGREEARARHARGRQAEASAGRLGASGAAALCSPLFVFSLPRLVSHIAVCVCNCGSRSSRALVVVERISLDPLLRRRPTSACARLFVPSFLRSSLLFSSSSAAHAPRRRRLRKRRDTPHSTVPSALALPLSLPPHRRLSRALRHVM